MERQFFRITNIQLVTNFILVLNQQCQAATHLIYLEAGGDSINSSLKALSQSVKETRLPAGAKTSSEVQNGNYS